jgi:hypothetical protein
LLPGVSETVNVSVKGLLSRNFSQVTGLNDLVDPDGCGLVWLQVVIACMDVGFPGTGVRVWGLPCD